MPLTGEYAPSAFDMARNQVDLYERSGGTEGIAHPTGERVIVLTSVGAKTGKLRKTPLMRVEHDGEYAVVASLGGAPTHPVWYYNLIANPHVELQDGPVKKDYQAREVHGEEYDTLVRAGGRGLAGLRRVHQEDHQDHADLRPHAARCLIAAFGDDGLRASGDPQSGGRASTHHPHRHHAQHAVRILGSSWIFRVAECPHRHTLTSAAGKRGPNKTR